eukprot:193747-Pleurochrysis_carterae.AAC.1
MGYTILYYCTRQQLYVRGIPVCNSRRENNAHRCCCHNIANYLLPVPAVAVLGFCIAGPLAQLNPRVLLDIRRVEYKLNSTCISLHLPKVLCRWDERLKLRSFVSCLVRERRFEGIMDATLLNKRFVVLVAPVALVAANAQML